MSILTATVAEVSTKYICVPYAGDSRVLLYFSPEIDRSSVKNILNAKVYVKTDNPSLWAIHRFYGASFGSYMDFNENGWLVGRDVDCEDADNEDGFTCVEGEPYLASIQVREMYLFLDLDEKEGRELAHKTSRLEEGLLGGGLHGIFSLSFLLPELFRHPSSVGGAASEQKTRSDKKDKKGEIYVIRIAENKFKVGFSSNTTKRLSSYKTVAPDAYIVKTYPKQTLKQEKRLHRAIRALFPGGSEVYEGEQGILVEAVEKVLFRS